MIEALKKLSDRTEFVFVLFTVFCFPIFYSSISMVAFLQGNGGPTHYTNFSLINLFELEVLTGCAAGAILYIRFWRISHFNINMGWIQTLIGTVILAGDLLLQYAALFLLKAVYTSDAVISTGFVISKINILVAIVISFVNPIFEELFVVSYIIQSLRKNHDAFYIITLSATIRMLYHLYQGPIAIGIFLMGLLHAYFYWRWKSLWPLIFAHCALNFMAFGLGI
jgi:membrane protease YdiL (CAAX protease family)